MTEQEITALGPAFAAYLRRFRDSFGQDRTAAHFDTYCRGLLSDLPRKSVEPIALEAGTAVRTLQEFLVTARWDHDHACDTLQTHLGAVLADLPADPLGTVGVIDETSCRKWGDRTPGVQRQYLGCVGKIDNGIVTVHLGVARGTFQALLDAELYLPKSWDADRPRCRAAGIPDDVRHRPKWRLAVDQWVRLSGSGVSFDWLVFDEGYGSKVPLLRFLNLVGQRFVAEVPVNFTVRDRAGGPARRADARLSAADARGRAPAPAGPPERAGVVLAGDGGDGVGSRPGAHAGGGHQRGDGRGEVLPDQRHDHPAGPGAGGGLPPRGRGACLPPGQAGGRADALRGAGLHRAVAAPDPGPGGAGVRGHPHGAAAGGKTRR